MNTILLSPGRLPRWTRGVVLFCLALACVACGDDSSSPSSTTPTHLAKTADTLTVGEVLQTDDRFSTLVAVLDSTELDTTLVQPGPYTLFAPPDDAFSSLPEGTMEVLLDERRERLRRILAHHIMEGRFQASDLATRPFVTTLSGDSLQVRRDSVLRVGNAAVVDADIPVANGVIHVVDQVLQPPPTEEE